ncbi:hypothetical protein ADL22_10930 [Streptomyces sp. NRRL F-4489]|uniref:hypothetical protein n=1 Tax=Streptomyces sp. NRRL F-4489 TaxID=1609095 RepID=UPI000748D067|nr:hypothetical protein [Streptomyces sp. NRRL F-4489]KUL46025.1 hypothetical protein ADL22_10930 [Streptomyces sp. NRRL F-4489]
MGEYAAVVWKTVIDGELVEVPATMDGIRAALPEKDRAAFDAEVRRTPAQDLHRVLARWALPAAAENEDEAIVARLRDGDFTGCVPQDGDARHPGAA